MNVVSPPPSTSATPRAVSDGRLVACRSRSSPRISPTSLAPSQTSTERASSASGNLRTVPWTSPAQPIQETVCPDGPGRTTWSCCTDNSRTATGEWLVTKACNGDVVSFAPSSVRRRMIRCGSRPCSSSSIRIIGASPATCRCSPATSSLTEPSPRPRRGTPSPP